MVEEKEKPNFLTAKFQIGSCKGPTSFSAAETVFHPDDIPITKKHNKAEVQKWKRTGGTKLGGERAQWEQSVYVDSVVQRRQRVNFEHDRPNMYQYNYRAEHLPPKALEPVPKPHKFKVDVMPQARKDEIERLRAADPVLGGKAKVTEEMVVNDRLADKLGWNQSTEVTRNERKAKMDATENARTANSTKKNHSEKGGLLKSYKNPEQREKEMRVELRRMKAAGVSMPVEAYVQQLPATDEKYNRMAKEPCEKFRTFAHSGVYEFNDSEGKWMWSDTASYEREGPGDLVKVKNPHAYNFASPTTV